MAAPVEEGEVAAPVEEGMVAAMVEGGGGGVMFNTLF